MMLVKIVSLLVAAALVSGLPEPDPDTKIDLSVDSQNGKVNSYLDVAKDAAGTSIKIVSNYLGQAMGYDCCVVNGVKYENGATNVPCDEQYPPCQNMGNCTDGNVQCTTKIQVTYSTQVFDNAANTLELCVESLLTFFNVMNIAAKKNNDFRFKSTDYGGELGEYITSIGGVANNISSDGLTGNVWMFYKCDTATDVGCELTPKGVSNTFPKNGDFFRFTYEFVNWTVGH